MSAKDKSRRVTLICNTVIGPKMASPGIRFVEFCKVLNDYFTVTLAIPPYAQAASRPADLQPDFEIQRCKTGRELKKSALAADVIITFGGNLSIYPFLSQLGKPLVVDLYSPLLFEGLQKHADRELYDQHLVFEGQRGIHTEQIRAADFVICASERQRDLWLGWLSALGRVNPHTYRHDPTLARLIDIVPFGLAAQSPVHDRQVLKGVYKSIGLNDKVILWGGGIWPWLDAPGLIKAVAMISDDHPEIKLFFLGVQSPNPFTTGMASAGEAIKLSQELGLYDRQVFFNEWAPYEQRHNYLLEADLGASLHHDHIETRFSFRTRILDYIWAGLPVLSTGGDILSEEIARSGLGRVVNSGDVAQVSRSLVELLQVPDLKDQYRANFERLAAKYRWETVMAPLLAFCAEPYPAADKRYLGHIPLVERNSSSWRSLPGKAWRTTRAHGISGLLHRAREFINWNFR